MQSGAETFLCHSAPALRLLHAVSNNNKWSRATGHPLRQQDTAEDTAEDERATKRGGASVVWSNFGSKMSDVDHKTKQTAAEQTVGGSEEQTAVTSLKTDLLMRN